MTATRRKVMFGIVLRSLGSGLAMMVVAPVVAFFAVLAVGHLAGACGAGSAGGCEMGAAAVGLFAVVPGFVLGAAVSMFRSLRARRNSSAPG